MRLPDPDGAGGVGSSALPLTKVTSGKCALRPIQFTHVNESVTSWPGAAACIRIATVNAVVAMLTSPSPTPFGAFVHENDRWWFFFGQVPCTMKYPAST